MNEDTVFTIMKDEAGDDYTGLIALVLDNNVEISQFVREGDTEISMENRLDALGVRFGSHPSDQKYLGIVNLYRTGDARLSLDGSTSSSFWPRGQKLARQAAEDLYDRVWPDVAELSRQFVHDAVVTINSRDRVYRSSRVQEAVASGAIDPWIQSSSMGDLLRKLLFEEEKEFLATGELTQKIGFVTKYGAAMLAVGAPYEKYRWGRAVSEVARKVNALQIIQITGGFLRDSETRERNGLEFLWGLAINPDASIEASARGVYEKKNGRYRVTQEIKVIDANRDEQYLIPAWREGV
jgi:hypothetical protein